MSTTLVHLEDHTMLYTCTTSETQSSGNVVEMVDTVGICKVDIVAAGTGAVYVRGVHTITKSTAAAWAVGDSVYYDTTDGNFNLVATANSYAGRVFTAATTTEASAKILLNFGNAGPT